MNQIRQTAFYLTAALFLGCLIQGELLWMDDLLAGQHAKQSVQEDLLAYQAAVESVWEELDWFPIPLSTADPKAGIAFENSWLAKRTYGGERRHEGTDLMPSVDEAGFYPVLSMTDGTVEQVGWLEKGGWRVGVRSEAGNYYYYAHLHSYSRDWKKGDPVRAGELLGTMGDSGYGPEGTTGQFPVHLHLGVYLPLGADQEMAVNPYWMLKYLENHKLSYSY